MTREKVRRWEVAGIAFIILVGGALHFVFEWTGYWRPIAWFAAVNESTWEHLKQVFWPGLLFALIEYPAIHRETNNFWVGKTVELFAMPAIIVILFYGYTAVIGQDYLAVDAGIFVVAVIVGQLISYTLLTARDLGLGARRLALVGFVVMVVAFALLSYYPPRIFLFEDPVTQQYGIVNE